MEIKTEKESTDYNISFDGGISDERGEELEDLIYGLEEVFDVEFRGDSFGIIIKGKNDCSELLDKIKEMINVHPKE